MNSLLDTFLPYQMLCAEEIVTLKVGLDNHFGTLKMSKNIDRYSFTISFQEGVSKELHLLDESLTTLTFRGLGHERLLVAKKSINGQMRWRIERGSERVYLGWE